MKSLIAILALVAGVANAATWERPAGGYTPTNHSINTTKYQTDRANNVAISSVKVDGDLNKAFQGLNDIEARTPPSVVGQAGKFLTNNGATSSWGLVLPASINSGAAASGEVLKADGSGLTSFGLLDVTSFPNNGTAGTYIAPTVTFNSAGLATAVTATNVISLTAINVSSTVSTSLVSASVVRAEAVSGTLSAITAKAWFNFKGTTPIALNASYNVSSTERFAAGRYRVSFTTPMADNNYAVTCSTVCNGTGTAECYIVNEVNSPFRTPTGFSFTVNDVYTGGRVDLDRINCAVYGN